ncbi:MAG: TIGR04255 family protein [Gemmatimonadetes bacterium]|nr:TIGR04255 family protein [Gemmatimonadota bacterium]
MVRSSSRVGKVKNFPNAPVSEVILGVTSSEKWLSIEDQFDAQRALSDTFPRVEILPPIADEWMDGFQLTQDLNPGRMGVVLVRLRSNDGNWMCQIQANKFYFNWIRPDFEPVGSYPGFEDIYQRFCEAFQALSERFPKITSIPVKYYDLGYHDRLEWQDYIDNLSDVHKIMRFNPPAIETPEGLNNSFSRYTYNYSPLGGYGVFAVNTDTAATGKQVLKLESTLRGIVPNQSREDWFNTAHMIQYEHFMRVFTPEVLKRWS